MTPVRRTLSPDVLALAVLTLLVGLAIWNRLAFDAWLWVDFDLAGFFLPWYTHLGDTLRSGDVPGWNPHLLSGTPFAGDPESGWGYLPAMVAFAFLEPIPAIKTMIAAQIVIATLSTYAFARALGMGAAGALAAALVYAGGPFLRWPTDGETSMAQVATWLPLALLGVEMAVYSRSWSRRAVAVWIGGIGVSQMLAAWLGQGAMYALLVLASYALYRVLTESSLPARDRVLRLSLAAVAVALGGALGAAGVLPRLATIAEMTLSEGYDGVTGLGSTYAPFELPFLLFRLLAPDMRRRAMAIGGAALVLAILAIPLARRRFAVPYFAPMTVVALVLMLPRTPLHELFYLLPRVRDFHEHQPFRVVIVAPIAIAVLAGATIDSLGALRGRRRLLWAAGGGALAAAAVAWFADSGGRVRFVGWPPVIAAVVALILVASVLAVRTSATRGVAGAWHGLAPALLAVCVFAQPAGIELTGSWLGWPAHPALERIWNPDESREQVLHAYASETAADPAGAFLQAQQAAGEPFRYLGYGGFAYIGDGVRTGAYASFPLDARLIAVVLNGRPFFLDLAEIQGYNPVQLRRYSEFVTAMNGQPLDYHYLYLLPNGLRSPLLRLLNVRYLVLDASLPPGRDDVVAITTGRREVLRTEQVVVYEDPAALPRAWIVYDVQQVARGEALTLLQTGAIDPRQTALVEGELPVVAAPSGSAAASAAVTHWEPDAITVAVETGAPGLLVLSEVYADGWRAYVDGERVDILPTDHILRGIPVPAGSSVVELRFDPPAYRAGMAISGLALAAMAATFATAGIAWATDRRRDRAHGEAATSLPEQR